MTNIILNSGNDATGRTTISSIFHTASSWWVILSIDEVERLGEPPSCSVAKGISPRGNSREIRACFVMEDALKEDRGIGLDEVGSNVGHSFMAESSPGQDGGKRREKGKCWDNRAEFHCELCDNTPFATEIYFRLRLVKLRKGDGQEECLCPRETRPGRRTYGSLRWPPGETKLSRAERCSQHSYVDWLMLSGQSRCRMLEQGRWCGGEEGGAEAEATTRTFA